MRPPLGSGGFVAVCVLGWATGVRAETPEGEGAKKSMPAVRTATPPTIDGRLDDAVWASAHADDRFTQFTPDEGQPPRERTVVRVLYDDRAIYVGVRCFDRAPDQIVARMTRRDRPIEADLVDVVIDSRHDHATSFLFRVSAAGVQTDALGYDGTEFSLDWDAVWDVRVSRDAEGWSAEYAIPLSVLRFSAADPQIWGFQVSRTLSRAKEVSAWSIWPSNERGSTPRFDHLVGLTGLRPRRTVELRPYLALRTTGSAQGNAFLGRGPERRMHWGAEAGVDVKLGVTRNLTLDATVHPDFGQVEADQVVLNLSRFEVFFPEKRPFFLESSDLFTTPLPLFYSRRLGRATPGAGEGDALVDRRDLPAEVVDAPTGAPLWTAAKLSGRLAPSVSLAGLAAVTGSETVDVQGGDGVGSRLSVAPPRAFSVLRSRWSPGGVSQAGLLATASNRLSGHAYHAAADHDAYALALDGQWQSPRGTWRWTGQVAASERAGGPTLRDDDGRPCPDAADPRCFPIARPDGTVVRPGARGLGLYLAFDRQLGHLVLDGSYNGLSPVLDVNDVGFLPVVNRHQVTLHGGYRETRPHGPFRNYRVVGELEQERTWDGRPLTRRINLNTGALLTNFWSANLGVGGSLPGQWDVDETFDGTRFDRPNGAIAFVGLGSDSRKLVVGSLGGFGFRDFYDGGYGVHLDGNLALQALPQLELALAPSVGVDRAVRFFDCTAASEPRCLGAVGLRKYTFAQLDSRSVSATLRGTYTFTPRLSVQAYAQLFLASGAYGPFRGATTSGAHPSIRRRDLVPDAVDGDSNQTARTGSDFETAALNVNTVVRWEFRPGSTLLGVYTRSQAGAAELLGRSPALRTASLGQGRSEDLFLLKLTLFWS